MESVLVVDNQVSVGNLLRKFLTRKGYRVEISTHATHALQLMKDEFFHYIICDYWLPHTKGNDFFQMVKSQSPYTAVIFTSSQVNLKNVVNMMKEGAIGYLSKPLNPDELIEALGEKRKHTNNEAKATIKKEERPPMPELVVGESKASKEVQYKVNKVGPTNYSVIIEGETGTGKESYARLIHQASKRKDQPFVAVDCGCLSRELAGSELFGHEKGAFTGAVACKTGFFELASGGTIFLDEISNLSGEIQIALLRALQEKVIRKVGGTKEIAVDVRIITATNEDLFSKSETSEFREDLFYRLSEFILQVPPLRDREGDIFQFIDFFLKKTAIELGEDKVPEFTDEAMTCLENYTWPGNVRELKNAIRRSFLFTNQYNLITTNALPEQIRDFYFKNRNFAHLTKIVGGNGGDLEIWHRNDLKSVANNAESERIREVLAEVKYNKTKAAEKLNIHRKTLYSKLKMLNISY